MVSESSKWWFVNFLFEFQGKCFSAVLISSTAIPRAWSSTSLHTRIPFGIFKKSQGRADIFPSSTISILGSGSWPQFATCLLPQEEAGDGSSSGVPCTPVGGWTEFPVLVSFSRNNPGYCAHLRSELVDKSSLFCFCLLNNSHTNVPGPSSILIYWAGFFHLAQM